jgi:hypothetical protein
MLAPDPVRAAMAEYRAYIVGDDGHFISFEGFICVDDSEAIDKAKRLVDGHDVELWSGARLVIRLQFTSDEFRALDRQLKQSRRMSKGEKDPTISARLNKLSSDLVQEKKDQQKLDDEK